jgi:hypothetical protein
MSWPLWIFAALMCPRAYGPSLYPNTLSPTPNDATPLPTASTTPANSVPRTGNRGLISPVRNLMKKGLAAR